MTTATLFDTAVELIRRGLPIVVCNGKVPLGGKEWHKQTVTEENLPGLLRQAREPAIGIKLGSGSVIDIESDSPDEEALFTALFAGCEPLTTPTFKSTRGKHRLFRFDERFGKTNRGIIHYKNGGPAKLGIRIGAGKAAQSVIPPSPGREWLVSWDDVDPAPLPDIVVNRILSMLPTDRHISNGKPQSDAAERARKYIAKIPGAVSGQGGHNQTFHVACVLVLGFDLDRDTALELVHEWNQTCEPPWSDDELEHKIDSAFEQPGERGYLLKEPWQYEPTIRNCTDMGNAERFAEQHGGDVRFCHPWNKWLVWDGRRWAIDEHGDVMRRAKRTARTIYIEASKAADKETAQALAKWAAASERRERLTAMLALAQSEQPIPIAVESLDAQPWLLNVENGTIDLRTGELREHRRDDYLTKLCPVEYPTEPGCDPELWLAFLERIFSGNHRLIAYVQRLIGSSLVGEVLENLLAIFYGVGCNGKSVLVETVCGTLGSDYAMNASTSLLMVDRWGRHPTERADLFGKRFVAANESGDGGRLSEETVKQLTSREAIRARRMREDSWEFTPSHSIILCTNHRPEIRGVDYGIWRRIHLVPFDVTIPPEQRDKELAIKLRAEWPAILRWAVAGCLDWQRNGLQPPAEVLHATDSYRAEQDILGEWIEEKCTLCPECEARARDLFHSYKTWSEGRSEKPFTQTRFGTRLTERGITKARDAGNRVIYLGIGLLPEGPEG
jgi:putative DNA primase/helicase